MTEAGGRPVAEIPAAGDLPVWVHPEWRERFAWLLQGTTGQGRDEEPFDLGLYGAQPVGTVMGRWDRLLSWSGMPRAVHSRQVHAADLRAHGPAAETGLLIGQGHDGHLTREPGVLLTVAVADCIPVFIVDAEARAVALVHAGWRGVAAGIVEAALARLVRWNPEAESRLWLHCGPSICGQCYEVGPEVHAAVLPEGRVPAGPEPIDLAAAVAIRAVRAGAGTERVTVSAHCTRCGDDEFFSHRGGSSGRQMGLLGIRA